jgi:protein-S-isoprenylcysteine O-methyltransferase Ste14
VHPQEVITLVYTAGIRFFSGRMHPTPNLVPDHPCNTGGSGSSACLHGRLAAIGRRVFGYRLQAGLTVTFAAAFFVHPAIATNRTQVLGQIAALFLVVGGLGLRALAAGYAGPHTRTFVIGGAKLVTAGPYAYVRNPIYLGSIVLGLGMVLAIGDLRMLLPCFGTFVALYFGIIPAEEAYLARQFPDAYARYHRHVPRLCPRLRPWPAAEPVRFDWPSAAGEWRLGLILAAILVAFHALALVRR